MKYRAIFAGVLALTVACAGHTADTTTAAAPAVKAELRLPRLSVGATRTEVLYKLGRPRIEISPDVWAYEGFHVDNPAPGQEQLTTLIVRFADRRVTRTEMAAPGYVAILQASTPHQSVAQQ